MNEKTGPGTPSRISISVERYPATSRILHWLIAVLVLLIWPLGLIIRFVKNEVSLDFYMIHESLGFLVLWLMLLRVGNRLFTRTPEEDGPRLERIAAASVHGLFYIFLIIMPLSGFLATNAQGFPLRWFGVLPIWSPIGKAPDIAWTLQGIHTATAWILAVLFVLHIGAVLMHHVIRRDFTLYRIL